MKYSFPSKSAASLNCPMAAWLKLCNNVCLVEIGTARVTRRLLRQSSSCRDEERQRTNGSEGDMTFKSGRWCYPPWVKLICWRSYSGPLLAGFFPRCYYARDTVEYFDLIQMKCRGCPRRCPQLVQHGRARCESFRKGKKKV